MYLPWAHPTRLLRCIGGGFIFSTPRTDCKGLRKFLCQILQWAANMQVEGLEALRIREAASCAEKFRVRRKVGWIVV